MSPSSFNHDDVSPTQLIEINRICDRFETAWRAGRRPAAEDHLGETTGAVRATLLRDLLAVELERRRALHEHPELGEYRARFPADGPVVEDAFARIGLAVVSSAAGSGTGRNLLFGLLALQNNFIDRDALLGAFNVWVTRKSQTLGAILLQRGAIDAARHTLLEALVNEHLGRHGGDPERSLAALAVGGSTRDSLKRVGDPDLDASLAHAGKAPPTGSDDVTALYGVGVSTEGGSRFRVLRPHARGGLGAVFVALDAELNREVALKEILDHHADNPVSRQRFLVEAEITGGLEHPGIVPVYGLGTYADGRPYYAMRFIKGDSLKEAITAFHADPALKADHGSRSLALSKLLRRFLDVCNAIDYAHSRGVLHRDIKPGNVIVGKYGETLVVDWGLAKSTGHREPGATVDERTLVPSSASGSAETLPGTALGTPAYMSPEQATGDLGRLGPRSDVYGLGATLYNLLTGRAPVATGDINAALLAVKEGNIQPPRLLDSTIDRALEAVCLKALAKRPEDRYATARALADDVERWLADEPVAAWREPLAQRARRWARKHRTTATGTAVALVVGLVGLAALATVQSRANRDLKNERDKTADALVAETKAKRDTETALAQKAVALADSEEARKRAEAVLSFLKDDVLAAARPEGKDGGLGIGVTVRQAIDFSEPKIAVRFKGQLLVQAEVRDALGGTYYYLGGFPLAIRQLEMALELRRSVLGPEDPITLNSRSNLAQAYLAAGRTAQAIKLLEETIPLMDVKLGPDHQQTLRSRNDLAVAYKTAGRHSDAIALHQRTLQLQEARLGPDHADTLQSQANLATAYSDAGRHIEAIEMQKAALRRREAKLGFDHPDTLGSRHNLATAYLRAGRTVEALKLFEATLKLRRTKLGPDHPDTLSTQNNLASAYMASSRTAEALNLLEETLKLRESKLGRDHPQTLLARNNLATAYYRAGRINGAIELLETTLRLRESKLGRDHPETLVSRNNLAVAYKTAGRSGESIAMLEGTLRLQEAKLGPDHPVTLTCRSNLAVAYVDEGRVFDAIELDKRALRVREATLGPDHPDTLMSRNNLAVAYQAAGQRGEALALHQGTLKLRETKLGLSHLDTQISRSNLAFTFESLGRWAEAEALRRKALAYRRKSNQPDTSLLAGDLAGLGLNQLKQSRWAEAEPLLRECLAIREKVLPDDWSRFETMSLLGRVLAGQGKFTAAEPLIMRGYEGMKARAARIPAQFKITHLSDAAERVVALYEAWGKPEQAASWKMKLGLADLPDDVFAPHPGR